MPCRLYICSLLHGLLGFACLYHTSVLNPMQVSIKQFLNTSLLRYYPQGTPESSVTWCWGLLNAALTISWLLGALMLPTADRWGRKWCCCVLNGCLCILGSILMAVSRWANMFELLILGHLLTGIATAFCSFSMIFVVECSPVEHQATAAALWGFGIPFWVSVGATVALPELLGNEENWPWTLALPILPSLAYLAIGCGWMHESPKYLYLIKNDVEKAREALQFYHGPLTDIAAFEQQMAAEAELEISSSLIGSLKEVVAVRHLRWPVIICAIAGIANAAGGGSNIVRLYSSEILSEEFAISPEAAPLISLLAILLPPNLIALIIVPLTSRLARRHYMFLSMLVAELGIVLVICSPAIHPAIASLGLLLSLCAYFVGTAVVTSALPAQLCPQQSRMLGCTAYMVTQGAVGAFQGQMFPVFRSHVGLWALLLCCWMDIPAFIFLWFCMPETKDRSIDEVVRRWREEEEELEMLLH